MVVLELLEHVVAVLDAQDHEPDHVEELSRDLADADQGTRQHHQQHVLQELVQLLDLTTTSIAHSIPYRNSSKPTNTFNTTLT